MCPRHTASGSPVQLTHWAFVVQGLQAASTGLTWDAKARARTADRPSRRSAFIEISLSWEERQCPSYKQGTQTLKKEPTHGRLSPLPSPAHPSSMKGDSV